MNKTCIYPGSFDPLTVGHMDIIRRSCTLFDRVIVAVVGNPAKHGGTFPVAERMEMIKRCCQELPQVDVACFDGLTVNFAHQVGATAMVRGLRNIGDFEAEKNMAQINYKLAPDVETVFLVGVPEHSIVSSSGVRELAAFGGSIHGYVPECIEEMVLARFNQHR